MSDPMLALTPGARIIFDVVTWIDALLLLMVVLVGAGVVASRNLFAAAMLSGSYSLLMALVWVNMAAMDVAFTEAAVGAMLLLGGGLTRARDDDPDADAHGEGSA